MKHVKLLVIATLICASQTAFAAKEPIKLAYIDALSGPFGGVGENALRQFEHAVDELVTKKGGVLDGRMIEIVTFDTKGSALTSQRRLRQAASQGIHYVLQGNSSHVATELTEAIKDRNERFPDHKILYLNFSANDPALTNELCNFWHFRFDPHAEMKMTGLVDMIASRQDIKRIYIIGQDYSFGHSVANSASRLLRSRRPDIQIDSAYHPVGVVDDFSPYVNEILSFRPDAIITGNWGDDMRKLGTALGRADVDVPVFTFYGGFDGTTAAIGEHGNNLIHLIHGGVYNPVTNKQLEKVARNFKQKFPNNDINSFRIYNTIDFLVRAMEEAQTDDPYHVAKAMEGMEFTSVTGNTVKMRANDHQLIEPLRISVQTNEDILFDADNSGIGFRTVAEVSSATLEHVPNSCQMSRPTGD